MLVTEECLRESSVLTTAIAMLRAARTAPKGKGTDTLYAALIEKSNIPQISKDMLAFAKEQDAPGFFSRDAENILHAECLVILGTKIQPMQVHPCGFCGFSNCDEKSHSPTHPCAFNTGDLGIAVGSAVSVAANHRVDNRIMFSVGKFMVQAKLLPEDVKIAYVIPLSVSGKNPFYDRKPKQ